jgi:hypothetical protein
MAGSRPIFRKSSIKQLVVAAEGKDRIEPSYWFSNGKRFTKRVQRPSVTATLDEQEDYA